MTTIKSIGVLGAGEMGESIAQRIAEEGLDVVLVDIKPEIVERAFESIKIKLEAASKNGPVTFGTPKEVLSRIQLTTDPSLLKSVSFVFEAIPEDWETKRSAFKNIAKICGDKTIFASSANSWRITDLAKEIPNPNRFVGMHFFWNTPLIPVFEIVKGSETSQETMHRCRKVSQMLGCSATICRDVQGFLVKRMQSAIVNEAVRLLTEGVADIPTIDAAAVSALGIKKGPFESMNELGVAKAKTQVSGLEELGNLYVVPQRLIVQATSNENWNLSGDIDKAAKKKVANVFRGVAILVGLELLDDKMARIEHIDSALQFGLGLKYGPFELSNNLGVEESFKLVKALAKTRESDVPALLEEQANSNNPWSLRYVELDVRDGVATIKINRPRSANALNEKVIDQLNQALSKVDEEPTTTAVVFTGTGKSLACNLESDTLIEKIKTNAAAEAVALYKKAQKLLNRIASMDKVTITCASGLTLGGGVELGLASKVFVAGPRAKFAFPETGWGIHPGLGGTQRLPRKVGKSIGKYLILTGEELSAQAAHRLGIIDVLAEEEESIEQIIQDIASGEDLFAEDGAPTDEELKKISLFNPKNSRTTLQGEMVNDSKEAKYVKKALDSKAPIALKLADKLIEDGLSLDLQKSLNWELASLELILGTKDALSGLESIGMAPPKFSGE